MTEHTAEQELLKLYHDENNFIIKLLVENIFDDTKYQEIINLYEKYISELSSNTDYVNRQVARFLVDIVTFLEGEKYQLEMRNDELATKVGHAHAKMLNLLYQLLV